MRLWVEIGWSVIAGVFFSGWLVVSYKNYLHYIKTQTLQKFSLYLVYLILKPLAVGFIFSLLNKYFYYLFYLDMTGYSLTYYSWVENIVTTLQLFLVGFMLAIGVVVGVTYRNSILLILSVVAFISVNNELWGAVAGSIGVVLMVVYLFVHKPNIRKNVLTKYA